MCKTKPSRISFRFDMVDQDAGKVPVKWFPFSILRIKECQVRFASYTHATPISLPALIPHC